MNLCKIEGLIEKGNLQDAVYYLNQVEIPVKIKVVYLNEIMLRKLTKEALIKVNSKESPETLYQKARKFLGL